jgi:hypothetical protein
MYSNGHRFANCLTSVGHKRIWTKKLEGCYMKQTTRITLSLLFVLLIAVVGIVPDAAAKSKLAKPVLVSPTNNTHFQHFPRVTTLAWKPVTHATGYVVERQYYGGDWTSYPPVTVDANAGTSYEFNFVGDQPGRWRVTAVDSTDTYLSSQPSAWRKFDYECLFTLPTPKLISPPEDAQLYHYPRTTTLAWQQVLGAIGYKVEIQFESGGGWTSYPPVTVDGNLTSSYTFSFVGAQPGRWRVTAIGPSSGGSQISNSAPSEWREFEYHI